MKTLIMTVGLPRSGKSFWAHNHSQNPIVNPDSIRLSLHGQPFIKEAEGFVWATARVMVASLFRAGHDTIILDATNYTIARRTAWKSDDWTRRYQVFDTKVETCVMRARLQSMDYLVPIIKDMDAKFEPLCAEDIDICEDNL